MKGIRKSLTKERIGAPVPTYSSLPTANYPSIRSSAAIPAAKPAPGPPKRVIRATEAYRARSTQELSFEQGDFFHVVSDEGGEDWFDAANPMTGFRGLVPASHFQVLGRNVRETVAPRKAGPSSSGAGKSAGNGNGGYDTSRVATNSYGPGSLSAPTSPQTGHGAHSSTSSSSANQGRSSQPSPANAYASVSSSSTAPPPSTAPKSQPLYGIVQYDFVAERADELDAKRGEPIIVIAQSNHEWFVAKPIGRLGGPGLIPVAFVEIQDMTTGKPVENVEELIRSAVVPQVEEWKKMTADYKSASIPLGRFDFTAQGSVPLAGGNSMGGAVATSRPAVPVSPVMLRQPSGGRENGSDHHLANSPARSLNSHAPASPNSYDDGQNESRYSYSNERMRYGLVTAASVESFHQEEGSFWFHLRASFSTGASLVLYRLYQDFYDFQIALMDEFPIEAGRIPPGEEGKGFPAPERILPMMPGPTDYEDEVVCARRVHDLSIYLTDLCALPDSLRMSGLMYEFLVPRAGDVEVAVGNGRGDVGGNKGTSIEGQYGELVEYLDSMDGPSTTNGGASGLAEQVGGMQIGNGNQSDDRSAQEGSDGRQSSGGHARNYSGNSNKYSPNVDGQSPFLISRL